MSKLLSNLKRSGLVFFMVLCLAGTVHTVSGVFAVMVQAAVTDGFVTKDGKTYY